MKASLLSNVVCVLTLTAASLSHAQQAPGWAAAVPVSAAQAQAFLGRAQSGYLVAQLPQPSLAAPSAVLSEAESSASLASQAALPAVPSASGKSAGSQLSTLSLTTPPTTTPGGNSADFITPEIQELARGLNYDPVKIFEYVHNYIEYEDYFGCKKGAYMTLLEGGGNSFDQAALLVALLRVSGLAPSYRYGPAIFSYAELTRWLGLDVAPYSHMTNAQFLSYFGLSASTPAADIIGYRKKLNAYSFLDAHGYPYLEAVDYNGEVYFVIPHVWVRVTVGSTTYDQLSPSWKDHTDSSKLSTLATAMGYSRSTLLAQAGGTVTTPDAVSGLNYANISSTLTGYCTTLMNYLKVNQNERAAAEVFGTRRIDQISYSTLNDVYPIFVSSFSADWLPLETWTAIPSVHISKLQIQLGQNWNATTKIFGTALSTHTLEMPELRGRKVSLTFSGNTANIRLDESLLTSTATVTATSVQMRLYATHNHYHLTQQSNGTYLVENQGRHDQDEVKTYLKGDSNAYAIVYTFSNAQNHLRRSQNRLDNYRYVGLGDSDWRVKTELLNVMGLSWMHQTYLQEQAAAPLFNTLPLSHHRFGRVCQEASYYIDVGVQFSGSMSRSGNIIESQNLFGSAGFFASAMEHSVIEQMQGETQSATSTVKLLYLANQAGQKVYRATSSNWSAINTSVNLLNYGTQTKANIQNALTAGAKALIPQNAAIVLNQWTGVGYAVQSDSSIEMIIGSNLFGGYNSYTPAAVNSAPAATSYSSSPNYNQGTQTAQRSSYQPVTSSQYYSRDPVDMASGAFILEKSDLSIGSGSSPRGITFTRQYNSHRRYDKSPGLGHGWTHNYQITATKRSSTSAALGESISYHAVPLYVAAYAMADLYRNHATAKEWATASLITQWFSDQIKYNAVAISMGSQTIEFIRMPDGSYEAPANMNLSLTRTSSGTTEYFTMTERHGATYVFNTAGRIASITDLWGKQMTFTYSGSNLTTVTDGYGRTLTLSWTSGSISSIADSYSRSVTYGYSNATLTTCTDVEGKVWGYTYDNSRRMVTTRDPSLRTIISNLYDSQSRVSQQNTFADAAKRYDLTYTGYCNTEQNPLTGRTCYLYDSRSRGIGTIDALGNANSIRYDGHDRITRSTTPSNEVTFSSYDRYNNLTFRLDPISENVAMTYDSSQRLLTSQDKRGNITTINSYNPQHQPLQVTAPGNRVTTTTYTSTGEVNVITDPEGNTTDLDYNSLGQLITTKTNGTPTAHYTYNSYGDLATSTDALGRITTMTYNKRRQLLTTTAPAIPSQPAAVISHSYDNEGMLASTTDPRGHVTTTTYSATGKPITTTQPPILTAAGTTLNNVITQSYDARDWPTTTVNSLGHTTTISHDAAQRPTTRTDPLGRSSTTLYDSNGRPIQVTDPLGRISKTAYTYRSEPSITTNSLNQNIYKIYDENGNTTSIINRRSHSYLMTYDTANRVTTLTTPSGKVTTTTYKLNDLIHTITEPTGDLTTYSYDSRLRLQTKTDPTASISYSYDLASNLTAVTQTGSPSITRSYDARNRLTSYTSSDGDLIQYQYDTAGNLTTLTYPPDSQHPSGKTVTYTYNARNQLQTVTDWASRTTTYQYDRLGRLLRIINANGTSTVRELDAAGQLLSQREIITATGRVFHYQKFSYDAAGQVSHNFMAPAGHPWTAPAFTGTYDDDNRLLTANGSAVVHDADGNMTSGPITATSGTQTLVYNARNQLTSAAGVTYTYDAEGRRRTMVQGANTTRYTIDPNGTLSRLLVKHNPDGTKTYYVYGLGLLYEASKIGAAAETTITHHYDQVGSTVVRTDGTGNDVGRAEYSPYGQITWQTGNMTTPFLYNGKFGVMTDANGLLHMRARFYSPYLMRFLNPDPIGFSGGMNWFAYCDGDPIMRSDPNGEFWFLIGAAIGGGLDYAAQVTANYANGQTGSAAWTNVNVTSIAISAGAGAITGGIGGAVSKVGTVTTRAVINGVANSTISAGAQITKNLVGVNDVNGVRPEWSSGAGSAAAWGAATGVGGSLLGDAVEAGSAYLSATVRSSAWNSASTASRQLAANGTVQVGGSNTYRAAGAVVGGTLGNITSNWPWNPFVSSNSSSSTSSRK